MTVDPETRHPASGPLSDSGVWLASYPRSGNTFLRIVLSRVFGLQTGTLYDVDVPYPGLIGIDTSCDFRVGQITKTHEESHDDAPAIYVVRDARASLYSYYLYARDIDHLDIDLADVIIGPKWPGSWSRHVASWDFGRRPRTLFLRYEDVTRDVRTCVDRVAEFLQMEPRGPIDLIPSFQRLRDDDPTFFRFGDNREGLKALSEYQDLVEEHHGDTLRRLGYL